MKIEVLQRAYDRERERRKQAEKLLEEKSRELFLSYEKLDNSHQELEESHSNLKKQKTELEQLINAYASVTSDLQLAAKLQADLLPAPITSDTHAAYSYFQPAQYVAGDAFDYFLLPNDVFAFYIIDVEGHGAASAMTSFAIHSQLSPKYNGICRRNLADFDNHADAVCATVKDLNKTFYNESTTSKYFTMIYGLLDLRTGIVTWCQAGHPAPIFITSNEVTEIGTGGFPVGTLKDPIFEAASFTLQPTDRLVLYSDGAIECFSENKEMFGKERFINQLAKSRCTTPKLCVEGIQTALLDWNNGDIFADDVTVLFIHYTAAPIEQNSDNLN